MPSKVSITKSFIDELADAVALKNGVSTYMSLNSMISLVGSMYGKKEYDDLREDLILKTYSSSTNISGATEIPDYAMAGLKSLQSVSFQSAQKIGNFAFADCKNLANISIPLATEIGNNAFQNCSSITNVSFPSVTKVGDYAFQNCKSLSQFSGSRVNSVGSHAFQNCTNLETPNFLLNPSGIDVGAYAFQSCSLISYAAISKCASMVTVRDEGGGYLKDDYITADYAFQDCKALVSASFTYGGRVPRGMFKGCSSLSSVESMPSDNIGSFAFDGCVMLNPRTSTNYFPSFGEGTFRSCLIDYLSNSYGFETNGPKSIPSYAFQYCSQLSYISFGLMRKSQLEYIGSHAFDGCSNLKSINNMLWYVKSIYGSAFEGCSSLSSIGSITSLVTLGEYAFADCVTLSSAPANMLKNLSEIKRATFSNCVNLSGAITVGSSCLSIGWSAFYNCSKITSFYGSRVRNIGTGAFRNCTNLSAVTLSTSLYDYGTGGIGAEAFKSCGILSINLGDLRSINASTFENCLSLSSVVGGSDVQYISAYAFKSCEALTSVSFQNCGTIATCAFQECMSLTEAVFPSCTYISSRAFYSCRQLSNISIPLCSVIGDDAFYGCWLLSSISLPEVTSIGTSTYIVARNGVFGATPLAEISLPKCTFIGSYAFLGAELLSSVYVTKSILSYIGAGAFKNCSNLISFNHGQYSTIASSTYQGCSKLEYFAGSKVVYIYGDAFNGCSKLMSIYLTNSTAKTGFRYLSLQGSNQFYGTPIVNSTYTGSFGSIYVYKSAYSQIMTDTSWSSYRARVVCLDP